MLMSDNHSGNDCRDRHVDPVVVVGMAVEAPGGVECAVKVILRPLEHEEAQHGT